MAKVLVVDDSLSVRKVVERALVGRQMEVVCAATGNEALERIELDEPDVVVCDVVMPDRDGYEICEFVKRHPKLGRTPVLLMSGIVNDEVRERAARVRSADVLSKPFAADELLRRLDALLGAGRGSAAPIPTPAQAASVPVAPRPVGGHGHPDGANGHHRRETTPPAAPIAIVPPAPDPAVTPELPVVVPVPPVVAPPPPPDVVPASPPIAAPEPMVAVPEPPKPAAPVASRSSAPSPPPAPASSTGSAAVLKQFAAIDGVQWAVLADREGFLLDSSGEDVVDAAVASALSACLTESSEGLGRELGRGPLQGMILEYAQGMVVLYSVGASALLAIAMAEPSALGKVRYFAKKSIPELLQAV
jgi:CheY-like chemotaxis protein/predicted regulator of Ras-like GTPase activity (Roadblock/LC7/MglB family)